ncbi:hypothetical protein IJ818_07480 [bacterium]|nr:hypothetical protein [bacterium]
MGLAAGQARYLFISNRINTVQGALMINSARQMRLADEASDIAEAKDAALNLKHWEFNGNDTFNYDSLMGKSAIEAGNGAYILLTNDGNNRVVLNNTYARAMEAAGINQAGGPESPASLIKFMENVAQPTTVANWAELVNPTTSQQEIRNQAIAADKANKTAAADFITAYGTPNPEKVTSPTSTPSSVKSVSDLLKKMGNLGSIGQLSTRDVDRRDYTWLLWGLRGEEDNTAGTINDSNYSFYNAVYNGKGDDVIVMLQSNGSFKDSNNIKTAQDRFVEIAHTIINKIANALGENTDVLRNKLENYVETLKSAVANTGAMRDADRDGDDWAQMALLGGDGEGSYLNLSELIRLLVGHACGISVSENYAAKEDYEYGNRRASDGSHLSSNNRTNFNINASFSYNIAGEKTDYEANDKGYTYPQWLQKWNALSDEVKTYAYESLTAALQSKVKNPNKKVEIPAVEIKDNSKDEKTLNFYKQIFSKACQNGWKEDDQLDQSTLTNKLINCEYLINHNNQTDTIKTSEAFANVNSNDTDAVISYYNSKEQNLKSQEKKLEVEQTSLQTELSALQTEEASVKSIIDKNVERGFNLFG